MIKRFISRTRNKKHGQAFVELLLVAVVLALMVSGVVEFGYLLNSYLKVLDGTREGARFSNSSVAFMVDPTTQLFIIDSSTGYYFTNQTFYINTAIEAMRVMAPIVLNGNRGDDIVVSVFSVASTRIVRWPYGYNNGWSLCANHTAAPFNTPPENPPLKATDWDSCSAQNSKFSTAQILALMDTSAPDSGVLLVEVFYNYPQILKLPIFAQIIPDPIPVYTFAVMPLSSAEPTPTARP
jgi:hypothetical protein